jgi:hypothetical protein
MNMTQHKIFITGDTHGEMGITRLSHSNWPEGKNLTKKDYVIILGDFGIVWSNIPDKNELYWLKWLDNKPWTTLFIDGNHDNHSRLQKLKVVKFKGGLAGKVSKSVYHLRRGEVYKLGKYKFFTMGGAASIDREIRAEHISWWSEEVPNYAECVHGLDNLEKHQYNIDYILSHTCPETIAGIITSFDNYYKKKDPTTQYLEQVDKLTEFKRWYFGHWHEDRDIGRYNILYTKIMEL